MTFPALFYYPELEAEARTVYLEGAEVAHVAGARRLRMGDRIELFDGRGLAALGRITKLERRGQRMQVEVEIEKQQRHAEPAHSLKLAAALPKGDRQATMLESATQLGITDFMPLVCERSVVKPHPATIKRWQRIGVAACKQCRRYHLPRFGQAQTLAELLDTEHGNLFLLADPAGDRVPELAKLPTFDLDIVLLVGPEGGFSQQEMLLAERHGAHKLWLGPHILRTETAAAAIIAAINQQMLSEPSNS